MIMLLKVKKISIVNTISYK